MQWQKFVTKKLDDYKEYNLSKIKAKEAIGNYLDEYGVTYEWKDDSFTIDDVIFELMYNEQGIFKNYLYRFIR